MPNSHKSDDPSGRHFVFSGLSASGKTTLVGLLSANPDTSIVPEHNDWIGGSHNFPKKPINIDEKKAKQQFFIEIDLERHRWVSQHRAHTSTIISDADFTSPIAHNYAERWLIPEFDIYEWLVERYCQLLKAGSLAPADFYFYLDATIDERSARRANEAEKRKRNDMFFTGSFPSHMRHFYWILMHPDSPRACLPAQWIRHSDSTEAEASRVSAVIGAMHESPRNPIDIDALITSLRSTVKDTPYSGLK